MPSWIQTSSQANNNLNQEEPQVIRSKQNYFIKNKQILSILTLFGIIILVSIIYFLTTGRF